MSVAPDRYELVAKWAEGAFSTLWRGRLRADAGFGRPVALRELRPGLAGDRRFLSAWAATATDLAEVSTPHVEQVLDVVVAPPCAWVISEWIEGLSLDRWLEAHERRGHPVPWTLAVEVTIELLRGLAEPHACTPALCHAGIDTRSVRIARDGTVKLLRFGASGALAATGAGRRRLEALGLRHSAPELVAGDGFTPATDQLGVGALLFQMLAGRPPWQTPAGPERDREVESGEVPDLGVLRQDVPPLVVALVERMLRVDPAERFGSVGEAALAFAQLLRSVAEPSGPDVLARSLRELRAEHPRGDAAAGSGGEAAPGAAAAQGAAGAGARDVTEAVGQARAPARNGLAAGDGSGCEPAAADEQPDMGPADMGPADRGPADMEPADMGPADMGPADMGPAGMGPTDMGPADMGPADMGPADMGPTASCDAASEGERRAEGAGEAGRDEGAPAGSRAREDGSAPSPPASGLAALAGSVQAMMKDRSLGASEPRPVGLPPQTTMFVDPRELAELTELEGARGSPEAEAELASDAQQGAPTEEPDKPRRYRFAPKDRRASAQARALRDARPPTSGHRAPAATGAPDAADGSTPSPGGLSPAETEFLDEDELDRLTLRRLRPPGRTGDAESSRERPPRDEERTDDPE